MAKEDIAHQGAMEAHVAIIRGIRINQQQNHFQVNTTTVVTTRTSGPCRCCGRVAMQMHTI